MPLVPHSLGLGAERAEADTQANNWKVLNAFQQASFLSCVMYKHCTVWRSCWGVFLPRRLG